MQAAVKTKKPRKQAVSGRFWAMRTYRGRIKDDHKIDVAFGTREELNQCKEESKDEWDDDEFYCVADEIKAEFPNLIFRKMTFCSGILILSR